jgi:hypothetical protein
MPGRAIRVSIGSLDCVSNFSVFARLLSHFETFYGFIKMNGWALSYGSMQYRLIKILILIGFGAFAGLDGPRIAANLAAPWAGVTERICIIGSLLWLAMLAISRE